MKWLFWNVRGVNKRYKQKELRNYMKNNNIKLVGLVETRVKEHNAQNICQYTMPRWESIMNYQDARNGRIWVGWDPNYYTVQMIRTEAQLIH